MESPSRFVYNLDVEALSANQIIIGGLPYTSSADGNAFSGAFANYQTYNTNAGDTYHIAGSSSQIKVYAIGGVTRKGTDAGITLASKEMILCGQYYTDA